MPGRLAFNADPRALAALFGLADVPTALKTDYNVAPYEAISVVAAAADGSRRLFRARWGLLPHWADHRDERPAPYTCGTASWRP